MSESVAQRVEQLAAALNAAQQEKTEAYLQSDWVRVWELTNRDIPGLEREIAALTTPQQRVESNGTAPPLDFDGFRIELVDGKNSIVNVLFRRQPRAAKSVKVAVSFTAEQRAIVEGQLREHVVFYECRRSRPITAGCLLAGPWASEPMSEADADYTAENAREGINDLRLIIQERARVCET